MKWSWLVLLVACDDSRPVSPFFADPEAGRPAIDAAPNDAGLVDGARVDGGPLADQGAPTLDARTADARTADARPAEDAGLEDATSPDAAPDVEGPQTPCLSGVVALGDFEIFAFEASRPDATAAASGVAGGGACSRPEVLPWVNLTRADAEAACSASGFRLCTDAEWQAACQGERRWAFPYAGEHRPGTCNDHVSGTGQLQPAGALADCRTPEGVFDQSGNVWEMTADGSRRGASWRVNAVMFRTETARCDITYVNGEAFFADDLGFRCCR
jgi:hypothetical protein